MYTSAGGGVIGAGTHTAIAERARAFLDTLLNRIDLFPADERVDLPPNDLVQITIITRDGRRRASLPVAAFWGQEPSTVVDVIGAAQEVISAIRENQRHS